ncbi:hypothetical protein RB628_42230, partial [Streptomyces sp. ADMS]|uniref:hypothetical protein n=1 Tax=Streptomyces sp. ADMS TaxID=3071415 RepID=UPI00296FFBCA
VTAQLPIATAADVRRAAVPLPNSAAAGLHTSWLLGQTPDGTQAAPATTATNDQSPASTKEPVR